MTRYGMALLFGLAAAGLAGGCCNSHPLCDAYGDVVDWVSQQEPELDFLYHPTLDINRAGQPEWCQSRLNRAFYRIWCGRDCPCWAPHKPPVYFYPSPYETSPYRHASPRAYGAGQPAPAPVDPAYEPEPPIDPPLPAT